MDKPIEVILQPIDTKSELDSSLHIEDVPSPITNHLNLTPPRPGNLSPGPPNNVPSRRTRVKAPPVCRVPALRKMNMSAETLSQVCFRPEDLLLGAGSRETSQDVAGGAVTGEQVLLGSGSGTFEDQKISPNQWASVKKLILRRTESRNGRDLQRFATDPKTGHLMRLTTGSVPIMSDGRILLVSSSRKEEWILPKGGWESDETLKVSALRETYEEGGVLGTLGPKLTMVEYETKKAKKRRLEMESLKKKYEHGSGSGLPASLTKDAVSLPSSVSIHSTNSSVCHSEDDAMMDSAHSRDHPSPGDKEGMGLIAKSKYDTKSISCDRADADAASLGSIASDSSTSCGYVRMTMFPLYVLEVREHWPESGRARKVVDIDTAIEMMKSRPEFHQVLLEVKKKGYHLNPHRRIGQGDFVDKI